MECFVDGVLKISVRNLVEFILRGGDIDNRNVSGASLEAMLAGGKLHRKIQKRKGANYKAEVPLKMEFDYEKFRIIVEGRADGIIDGDIITIDEIKGVRTDLEYIKEPVYVHKAQAMCYGYFYCAQNNLDKIKIHMTYANLDYAETDSEEIKEFEEEMTFSYLEEWFKEIIDKYYLWAEYLYENIKMRDESARDIQFPFEYRDGQREIVKNAYKAMNMGANLYIQAPTGVGKTMSVLFPAIKVMSAGKGEKIFYLTAKTITGTVAREAYNTLRKKGLHFRNISLTAKEKMCVIDKMDCNPASCERACGHYDRVNDAVFDIINNEFDIDRDKILLYAQKHNVCPFEMELDISNWMDGIICDYNYAFDPNASLKRYFEDGVRKKYLFLVDEAHNLVDRAREMYSATLVKERVMEIGRFAKNISKRLHSATDKVNKEMLALKRKCDDEYILVPQIAKLELALLHLDSVLEKFLDENRNFVGRDDILTFYFEVKNFLYLCERVDDCYRICCKFNDSGEFCVNLMCIDPSNNLANYMEKAISTIFFSATLLPVNYYKELLSGNKDEYAIYVESPFDRNNRLLIMAKDVTSKYTRRNEKEYERIAEYIKKISLERIGNYMVFFPSYALMNSVYAIVQNSKWSESFKILVQNNSMKEEEREEFLKEFEKDNDEAVLAFCVMGGIFSEGIDLAEDKLIGSIVVGTGLPQVCSEKEIIKGYFDEMGVSGFDYAYRYPGINKVLQAAGRVIRTVNDVGVIALLDERFSQRDYMMLFPKEWSDIKSININEVDEKLKNFWNKK